MSSAIWSVTRFLWNVRILSKQQRENPKCYPDTAVINLSFYYMKIAIMPKQQTHLLEELKSFSLKETPKQVMTAR